MEIKKVQSSVIKVQQCQSEYFKTDNDSVIDSYGIQKYSLLRPICSATEKSIYVLWISQSIQSSCGVNLLRQLIILECQSDQEWPKLKDCCLSDEFPRAVSETAMKSCSNSK